jgi:DNA replication protein DnaT
LGEFVAYWMGRPQMQFSQFQWTQKFVFQLKQRRLANGISTSQKVGSQLVKPKASVEADDNAKKLVEKYRTKQ